MDMGVLPYLRKPAFAIHVQDVQHEDNAAPALLPQKNSFCGLGELGKPGGQTDKGWLMAGKAEETFYGSSELSFFVPLCPLVPSCLVSY